MLRRSLHRLLTPIVAVALAASAIAQAPRAATHEEILDKASEVLHKWAYLPDTSEERLDELLAGVREEALAATTDGGFAQAVNEMLAEIGASHVELLTRRQVEARIKPNMVGLGVELRLTDDGANIVYVFPESGADKIGLRPGYVITAIDGEPYDPEKGASGPVGTTFSVTYRTLDGVEHSRRVVRQQFELTKDAVVEMRGKDTGYLRVWSFMRYPRRQIREAIASFRGVPHLVLDLRSNGGGSVIWMMDLLSYFLPEGTEIGSFLSREPEAEGGYKPQPLKIGRLRSRPTYGGKLVVLIDEGSASASEIAAAGLQDQGRAILVGRPSGGAVLTSMFYPVGGGFELQVPRQDYKTKNGVRLEGTGVKPDVELEPEQVRPVLPGERDEAIEIALKVARGEIKPPPLGRGL
jgi:carboxyl-terminal processing protease